MRVSLAAATAVVSLVNASTFAGVYGSRAFDYVQGNITTGNNNPNAATGLPEPAGDGYYGALTPFNPAYLSSQVLIVGAGGSVTLQLSAPVGTDLGASLGVFDNTGIADQDPDTAVDENYDYTAGGRGFAGSPLIPFGGGAAMVSVSKNGVDFAALSTSPITFHMPTNGYTDNIVDLGAGSIGTTTADFFKPSSATLNDYKNRWYDRSGTGPTILDLLNGSGGGTWLSLNGVPYDQINYVKFDVPNVTGSRLALDAVTAVPEPAAFGLLLIGSASLLRRRK